MARKDDLRMLFNFMIELLKDESLETNNTTKDEVKQLLVEESKNKTKNFGMLDAPRIKTIMDKIDAKEHENAVVKHALNTQAKDYKKEIEDLKEAFNKKVLKEDKLEEETQKSQFSGGTVYSEFISKISL